ncbi:MAG: hypothetical protein ACI4TP_01045 [Anaerotignum sp.]
MAASAKNDKILNIAKPYAYIKDCKVYIKRKDIDPLTNAMLEVSNVYCGTTIENGSEIFFVRSMRKVYFQAFVE